jgi:hypothetical protein
MQFSCLIKSYRNILPTVCYCPGNRCQVWSEHSPNHAIMVLEIDVVRPFFWPTSCTTLALFVAFSDQHSSWSKSMVLNTWWESIYHDFSIAIALNEVERRNDDDSDHCVCFKPRGIQPSQEDEVRIWVLPTPTAELLMKFSNFCRSILIDIYTWQSTKPRGRRQNLSVATPTPNTRPNIGQKFLDIYWNINYAHDRRCCASDLRPAFSLTLFIEMSTTQAARRLAMAVMDLSQHARGLPVSEF